MEFEKILNSQLKLRVVCNCTNVDRGST